MPNKRSCFNFLKCISLRMKFEVQDAVEMEYPNEYYDAVHSRDAILHMKNKTKLFGNIYKCLKPGGKLLITDYCRNENSLQNDPAFSDYVKKYDYDILTVEKYGELLKESKFSDVVAIDNSKHFLDILHKELDTLSDKNTATEIITLLNEEEYTSWCNLWRDKINRVKNGSHVWGLFTATKPL